MTNRKEKAVENHNKGYNCAQAVSCAFCDLVDTDESTIFKMTEGFGLGMGCMEATCGAISGAAAIIGLKNSSGKLEAPDSKANTYHLSRELVQTFKNKNHSIICKDLKGVENDEVLRSCKGCIEDAAEILDEILAKA